MTLLLLSYGAPERQEDVVPFLHNIFAGKNIAAERIAAAVEKYERLAATAGLYSHLNTECRKLIDGIRQIAPDLPIYWGNLFWRPLLTDAVAEMKRNGVERAVCFATSVFDSPSGNQRYADALAKAAEANPPMRIEKLPLLFDHPLFIEAQAERLCEILPKHGINDLAGTSAHILFSAHSIPIADAVCSRYVEHLQSTCRAVIEKTAVKIPWELVYQSRSGRAEHWLRPDIKERIGELAEKGYVESIIVSPIGFFCENMETEYDLDMEVGECCRKFGLNFYRARAVGAMPQICRLIYETAERYRNKP